jgi:hypothetical protein
MIAGINPLIAALNLKVVLDLLTNKEGIYLCKVSNRNKKTLANQIERS